LITRAVFGERMIERVQTGIPGFDEILNGGIPKRNVVLLAGDQALENPFSVTSISIMD